MSSFSLRNHLKIDSVSYSEVINQIKKKNLDEAKFIATLNVDQYINLRESDQVAEIYRSHYLNIVDGQAFGWLLRINFRNFREFKRIAGVDLTREILKLKQIDVAILGSDKDELLKTVKQIHWKANLTYHNPMPNSQIYEKNFVQELRKMIEIKKPHVVFLCLGSPKQEQYMSLYLKDLPTYFVGVGGTFAMLSGKHKRAPRFVQVIGFEWLFRWIQEPRRLKARYVKNIVIFPKLLLFAFLRKL